MLNGAQRFNPLMSGAVTDRLQSNFLIMKKEFNGFNPLMSGAVTDRLGDRFAKPATLVSVVSIP